MSRAERDEAAVRRLLDAPPPPVPRQLRAEAAERGGRLLRRNRAVRRALWLLLCATVTAVAVWAAVADEPTGRPADTTPPLTGW
ncbi:hypothetical protein ACFWIA_07650 [Streptomyces sp. NPDC127068]|uniref:hypothetical protein n=1 Tax=Streptomyces sp. NPDC127068 TaxID=3347127 RepID=UPI00365B5FA0